MRAINSRLGRTLIFAGLLSPFFITACAVRVSSGLLYALMIYFMATTTCGTTAKQFVTANQMWPLNHQQRTETFGKLWQRATRDPLLGFAF